MSVQILRRDGLLLGGFAGLKEHHLIKYQDDTERFRLNIKTTDLPLNMAYEVIPLPWIKPTRPS